MTQQAASARPPARGRLRRILPLLLVAWLVLEIWLLTVVASVVGWLLVVLLLIAGAALGGGIVRRAGSRALSSALGQRRGAVRPPTGTSLTVLAGALLMLPGFLSDVIGLSLLFPPTRALWRAAGRRAARRVLRSTVPMGGAVPFADAMRLHEQLRIHRPDGKVVPGEVVDPTDGPTRPDRDDRPPLTG